VKVRTARKSDIKFVLDSWSKSYRTSPWAGVVPNNKWHDLIRDLITQLVARGAVIHVAADDTNDDHILGWVCTEKRGNEMVLHYAWVRPEKRAQGIATRLIDESTDRPSECKWFYTCRTNLSRGITQGMVFAPAIARRK
jgi:ribosomal protein S18 acetylase RimI-like enzyme